MNYNIQIKIHHFTQENFEIFVQNTFKRACRKHALQQALCIIWLCLLSGN